MTTQTSISQQIWLYLHQDGNAYSTAEIGHHFDLGTYRARHYLQILCENGKIARLSSGRGRPSYWQAIKCDDIV